MEPTTHFISAASESLMALGGRLNAYILIPLCLAVLVFVIGYFRNYEGPAQRLKGHLARLVHEIKAARAEKGLSVAELENRLDYIFEHSPFSTLWAEYRQSLHTMHAAGDTADVSVVLATVPAETYFSKESLIDIQINADFYRHLPGMLTGIGIIGTFSGLVWGLHEFRPDPGEALETLPLLLQEVTSAFIGSGLAILAAIFITYKEKSILNQCYRLVDALNKEIDGTHSKGVGEVYLSRLVRALEHAPTASTALKDNLLSDLSKVMHDVASRHTETQQQMSQSTSTQIADAIKTALAEPMAQLSGVVQNVTHNQSDAVGDLLENLLTGFIAKLGETVGEQIQGINTSIEKTSRSMDQVQDAMNKSIGSISHAGVSAADRMSDRLENALSRSISVQQQMSTQLFEQQKQSAEMMDSVMDRISHKLEDMLSKIVVSQEQVSSHVTQQQKQSAEVLNSSIDRISMRLEDSISRVTTAQDITYAQAVQMQRQSHDIMDDMMERVTIKLEDTLLKVVSVQEDVSGQVLQQQRQSAEILDGSVTRIAAKLEDSLTKAIIAQDQTYTQGIQMQKQSHEIMSGAMENISIKLEDTLSKIVSAQEQVSVHVTQQQQKSADVLDGSVTRITSKLEEALLNVAAAQDRTHAQAAEMQKQSHTLMDNAMDRVSEKLEGAIAKVISVQEQVSEHVLQQQKETSAATDMTMKYVLSKLQSALADFAQERTQQIEHDRMRHDSLMASTQTLYSGLADNVGKLVENVQATSAKTSESLTSVQTVTLQAISGMKDGASVMLQAADRFTTAGNSMSGLTETMAQAASHMHVTSTSMQQSFEAYDAMRGMVQQHVVQLQGMMQGVKRENSVSRELVADMERIVNSLAQVERQSKEYLDRVNEVLKRSFQDFGVEMIGQVRNISAESNRQLGTSLQALSSTVDSMVSSVTKLRRVG